MDRLPAGRQPHDLRNLHFDSGYTVHAEGSVLVSMGLTRVLCTVSIEESVPGWLKGKGQGWVTAEYSMLPRATHTRTKRDREKVSGRTHEIQRLIGRALRATVDMTALGERSVVVDCDVLQADGGTRTASINGAYVALSIALGRLHQERKLSKLPLLQSVAAVSIGMLGGQVLTDIDYREDSSCDVDANFVFLGDGKLVEVQGTGEKAAFSEEDFVRMLGAARVACTQIREAQLRALSSR